MQDDSTPRERSRPYTRHGLKGTPEHRIWIGIRFRCLNPTATEYHNYGGRGITICPEWTDFRQFLADMGTRPSPAHSVERADVNGPYAPWNCHWALLKEQCNNQRRSRKLTFQGRTRTVTEWEEELGFKPDTIRGRLNRGWSSELALTTPPGHSNRHSQSKPVYCKYGHLYAEHGAVNKVNQLFCRTCRRAYDRTRPRKRDRRKVKTLPEDP